MDVITHYDMLIDEDNDPFRDPPVLQKYMDLWDGQIFIDSMKLTRDKKVLEIGIGTGRIASKVAPYCLELWGIDISPRTIERAKENLRDYGNIKFICADFTEYVFYQTFNIIYSSLTLMHFDDKKHFLYKVDKLLDNNGIFCLSIDKSNEKYIDMGSYQLRVFPDNVEEIVTSIGLTNMDIVNRYETELANIFVCIKHQG